MRTEWRLECSSLFEPAARAPLGAAGHVDSHLFEMNVMNGGEFLLCVALRVVLVWRRPSGPSEGPATTLDLLDLAARSCSFATGSNQMNCRHGLTGAYRRCGLSTPLRLCLPLCLLQLRT